MDFNKIDKAPEILLGPEYDSDLFEALSKVLKSEGAISRSKSWGIGGSQEISAWEFCIGDLIIHVKAETYIGLSISGPKTMIERIAKRVKEINPC